MRVVLGVLLAVAVVVATAPRSCCVRARREYARVGLREDPECARLLVCARGVCQARCARGVCPGRGAVREEFAGVVTPTGARGVCRAGLLVVGEECARLLVVREEFARLLVVREECAGLLVVREECARLVRE